MAQGRRGGTTLSVPTISAALGRPTSRSMTVNLLAASDRDAYVEYGTTPGQTLWRSATQTLRGGVPAEVTLPSLQPDTRYFYRVRHRTPGDGPFATETEQMFSTARGPGAAFAFGVQGDSHPEREGRMFSATLYSRTIEHARQEILDFYLMLGDDFSIERLIARGAVSAEAVNAVYADQRAWLAPLSSSTPLFLVNGNHEQAARVLLDGTPLSPAVLAGRARTAFFPLPAPDAFYSGDAEAVEHVGLLRDYYAWTWGDALFVVLDPYWHSPTLVDSEPGGGGGQGRRARDLWDITIGDAQYTWLTRTLEASRARYIFVFVHHVMGTGRGGVEVAGGFEWGGGNGTGRASFKARRPTWPLPIHALLAKHGVTIVFQGHDHLYARQEKDGVIYQTVPNPADDTYTAFNRDAYRSGGVATNAGHLRVSVAPDNTRVDYVRSWLPGDSGPERGDGDVSHTYVVQPRR